MRSSGGSRSIRMTEVLVAVGDPRKSPVRRLQQSYHGSAVRVYLYVLTPLRQQASLRNVEAAGSLW